MLEHENSPSGAALTTTARRSRLAAVCLALPMTAVALMMSAGTATGSTARVDVPNSSSYCSLITSYVKSENATSTNTSPAALKQDYQAIQSDESRVLLVSPSQLVSSYKTVFSYLNSIVKVFAKYNYNIIKVSAADLKAISTTSAAVQSAISKTSAYDKNVCHVAG